MKVLFDHQMTMMVFFMHLIHGKNKLLNNRISTADENSKVLAKGSSRLTCPIREWQVYQNVNIGVFLAIISYKFITW